MPAEAVQPVAQVVGAADEDEAPGEAQVPEAALELRPLALLHRVRAVRQARLHVAHLGREALRAAAGSCITLSYNAPWILPDMLSDLLCSVTPFADALPAILIPAS